MLQAVSLQPFQKKTHATFPVNLQQQQQKKNQLVTECILEQVCTVLQETGSSNLYLILLFHVIC